MPLKRLLKKDRTPLQKGLEKGWESLKKAVFPFKKALKRIGIPYKRPFPLLKRPLKRIGLPFFSEHSASDFSCPRGAKGQLRELGVKRFGPSWAFAFFGEPMLLRFSVKMPS